MMDKPVTRNFVEIFVRFSDNRKKTIKINRTKKIEGDALNMLKLMVSEKKAVI